MAVVINDWNDLDGVRNAPNSDYELNSDIGPNTTGYVGVGDGFSPINGFDGSFDGKEYTISGIEYTNQDYVGLFARAEGNNQLIQNLGIECTVNIVDNYYTGGLVGRLGDDTTVKNCFVDITANVDKTFIGGLIGLQYGGSIQQCFTTGNITNIDGATGGFVSWGYEGVCQDCYSTVNVESDNIVGGFTARIYRDYYINCYSTGSVVAPYNQGGFVGSPRSGDHSNNYWDIESSGQNDSTVVATGLTTSQMQGSAAATNMVGFDFSTIWTTTDGYPELSWAYEPPAPPAQIASIDPASVSLTAQEPAFSVGALVASVGYGSVTTTGYAVNGSPSPVSSTVDGGSLSVSATGGSISAGSVAATLGSRSMTTAAFDVNSTPEPITSPIESDSLSLSAQTVTPLPESMVAAVAGDSLSVAYQQPSVDVGTIRAAVETGNILLEPQSPHVLAANVSTTLVPGTATLTENELLFQLRPIVARVEPAGVSLSPYSIGIRTWLSDYEYDSFDVPVIPYSITIEDLDEIDTSLLLENPYEGYTLGIEDILNDF